MLKLIIDSLEDVDEPLREHYIAGEGDLQGKFILDGEERDGHKIANVGKLMSALNKEREAAKSAATKLSAFGDLDPKTAKEAIDRLKTLDDEVDDKTKTQIETLRKQIESEYSSKTKQLSEKHQEALGKIEERTKTLESRLHKALVVEQAMKALNEAGARAPKLLLPHIESSVRMTIDENGNESVVVVGDDGQPRMSRKSGTTANMTIEEFVHSLKDDDQFAVAFEGSKAKGFDTGKTDRKRGTHTHDQGMSPQERLRRYRETNKR